MPHREEARVVKVDVDGYPRDCGICGLPVVKDKADGVYRFNAQTHEASTFHVACEEQAKVEARMFAEALHEEAAAHA